MFALQLFPLLCFVHDNLSTQDSDDKDNDDKVFCIRHFKVCEAIKLNFLFTSGSALVKSLRCVYANKMEKGCFQFLSLLLKYTGTCILQSCTAMSLCAISTYM